MGLFYGLTPVHKQTRSVSLTRVTVCRHKGVWSSDSGRPRRGLWSTFGMKNGKGLFKDLFILSANRMIFDCPFIHVMPK